MSHILFKCSWNQHIHTSFNKSTNQPIINQSINQLFNRSGFRHCHRLWYPSSGWHHFPRCERPKKRVYTKFCHPRGWGDHPTHPCAGRERPGKLCNRCGHNSELADCRALSLKKNANKKQKNKVQRETLFLYLHLLHFLLLYPHLLQFFSSFPHTLHTLAAIFLLISPYSSYTCCNFFPHFPLLYSHLLQFFSSFPRTLHTLAAIFLLISPYSTHTCCNFSPHFPVLFIHLLQFFSFPLTLLTLAAIFFSSVSFLYLSYYNFSLNPPSPLPSPFPIPHLTLNKISTFFKKLSSVPLQRP